ncbi:hypothetical protein ONS96_003717 [Cadophora gregata f. sp. sojae]|nr:hypothetical protein ONS96_003717 [Cadophora gregata f. sp. sojae]
MSVRSEVAYDSAYQHYREMVERGKKLCQKLDDAPGPDHTDPPYLTTPLSFAGITNDYDTDTGVMRVKGVLGTEMAENWNVSLENFRYVDVGSKPKEGEYPPDNAYEFDKNSPETKLFPNEVVWQSWLKIGYEHWRGTQKQFDCSKLRLIGRTNVVNEAARTAIWFAARHSSFLESETEKGSAVYTRGHDGYYAILGSPNGGSSMRLLTQYKKELRGRSVEKIIVVGDDAGPTGGPVYSDFSRARAFLLVLWEPSHGENRQAGRDI